MSAAQLPFTRRKHAWLKLASMDYHNSGSPDGVTVNLQWCPIFNKTARRLVAEGLLVMRRLGGRGGRKTHDRRESRLYLTDAGATEFNRLQKSFGELSRNDARGMVDEGF